MFKYQPYARNVKKKPGKSGIIALKTEQRQEDQDLAKSMMSQNCGSQTAKIIEEGEVAIGTVTQGVKTSQAATKRPGFYLISSDNFLLPKVLHICRHYHR